MEDKLMLDNWCGGLNVFKSMHITSVPYKTSFIEEELDRASTLLSTCKEKLGSYV